MTFEDVLQLQKTHEEHLSARDRLLGLQIGVKSGGTTNGGFICVAPAIGRQGSLDVGDVDVAVGSTLQLHVQDGRWAQREMQRQLQVAASPTRQGVPKLSKS